MKLLSLDVETSGNQPGYGLQPCRALTGDAWLTSIAFASKGGVSATLNPSVEMIRRVLVDCARRKITIVGWNTPFDMAWLIAIGLRDEVFACDWLDGMLIWRHLTCSPDWTGLAPKSYGLKAAVAEHRPEFAGYDEDIDFDDESPEAREKLRVYNGADADHTLWLVEKFWADLSPKQRRVALLEAHCLPLVAEAHVLGIHGNTDAAVALAEKLEADADAAYQALTADGEAIDPAVLASPTKLRKLLFEDWGLPVVKLTDKGAESTDKDALSQLAPLDPRAGMLHDYREARNNRTKFAVGMARSLAYNGAGVTRPVARVFGTYTSRMTYSSAIGKGKNQLFTGVALHQWKRDQLFRSLIEAPAGYTLIEWDFAGQEFRWMAVLSGDATMLKMCAPGEDAHAYMGGQVSGRTYADMQTGLEIGDTGVKGARQLGKVANLSCIAERQNVLTSRGYVPIEEVTVQDRLWDGVEWVTHGGVVEQGLREVIDYAGIQATEDHEVLVAGQWVRFGDAARLGWRIEPPLVEGWSGVRGQGLRLMDGVEPGSRDDVRRALREVSLCLRHGEGREFEDDGVRPVDAVQGVWCKADSGKARPAGAVRPGRRSSAETSRLHATALHKPEGRELQELRREGDRVSLRVSEGGGRLHQAGTIGPDIPRAGPRPQGQQRPLRAREPAAGDAQRERAQHTSGSDQRCGLDLGRDRLAVPTKHDTAYAACAPHPRRHSGSSADCRDREAQELAHHPRQVVRTFDILDAGPRNRFVVGNCIVHNCQYRTSARTLRTVARAQHRLTLNEHEAQSIWTAYRRTYPGVKRYWQDQCDKARHTGVVETIAGRRLHLGKGPWPREQSWGRESAAINYPVQGSGADQKYLALAALRTLLPRYGGRFYFELHDGLFAIVPDEHAVQACREIKHALSNLPYEKAWGVQLPIQFPVDAKLGKSWGSLKEFKE